MTNIAKSWQRRFLTCLGDAITTQGNQSNVLLLDGSKDYSGSHGLPRLQLEQGREHGKQ